MNQKLLQLKYIGYSTSWLIAYVFLIMLIMLYIGCASNDTISGTGSQSGNGRITCLIYNNDGSPASGAAVHLRSQNYIANIAGAGLEKITYSNYDTWTDENGAFSIDSVDTGSYCIEINDGKSHAVLLNCSINEKKTFVQIPDDTLQPTGSIKGVFSSSPYDPAILYIQIYGLERLATCDKATGVFAIDDLPCGSYEIRIEASSKDYLPVQISNVKIASNEITDIGKIDSLLQSQWSYSERLYLNTSSTGAGVAETVTNFPVLVRLNSENFDFNQTQISGTDIRFTNADCVQLPYEIDRWDPVSQKAEIWVRVDTIYGNDSSQYIKIYWGNHNVSVQTANTEVFDTANGFQGVWHLESTEEDYFYDATVNRYHGWVPDSVCPMLEEGIIGTSRRFDGRRTFISMPNTASGRLDFPQNGSYMLSAWVMADTLIELLQTIASKGKYEYFLWLNGTTWQFSEFHDRSGWDATSQKAVTGEWVLLNGVRDGSKQYLYVNGVPIDTIQILASGELRNTGTDFIIGRVHDAADGCYFKGAIDEVRVENRVRNADWIKLSFMNQKADDRLVIFK